MPKPTTKTTNKSSAQKPQVEDSSIIVSKKRKKLNQKEPESEIKAPKKPKLAANTKEPESEIKAPKKPKLAANTKVLGSETKEKSKVKETAKTTVARQADPLHYCREVVQELLSKKKENIAWPFHKPVDAQLNPDYYTKIKTPMDLSTIEEKLKDAKYSSVKEFEQDVSLMFRNCRDYNNPEETIVKNATKLEKYFVSRMSKMVKNTESNVQNRQEPNGKQAADKKKATPNEKNAGHSENKAAPRSKLNAEEEPPKNGSKQQCQEGKNSPDDQSTFVAELNADHIEEDASPRSQYEAEVESPKNNKMDNASKDAEVHKVVIVAVGNKSTNALAKKSGTEACDKSEPDVDFSEVSEDSEYEGKWSSPESDGEQSTDESGDGEESAHASEDDDNNSDKKAIKTTVSAPKANKKALPAIEEGEQSTDGSGDGEESTHASKYLFSARMQLYSSKSQAKDLVNDSEDDDNRNKKAIKTTVSSPKANEKAGHSSTRNKACEEEYISPRGIIKTRTTGNLEKLKPGSSKANVAQCSANSLKKLSKAKAASQQLIGSTEDLIEVGENSGTPAPGKSTKPVQSQISSSDSNNNGRRNVLKRQNLNPHGPPAKKTKDDYPYTEVSEVFDTSVLEAVLSDDKKRSIEIRLEEAVMKYDAKLDKLSSGKELKWLEFKRDTMGVDPTVILAGVDTSMSYKLNKAVTVVNRYGNGHIAQVNEWNVVIGKKGINKSGGFKLTLDPLQEMENEDVDVQRALFEKHIEELIKEAEEMDEPSTPECAGEAPKTPSKSSPKKKSDSPKKKKELPVFQEMCHRNLLQSGTAEGIESHMYNAVEKNFMMYFDEASTWFCQLYTSGGPGSAKRTHWLTTLLSFFSSQEARSAKVCKGSQRLPKASVQVYAVAQPLIFLDLFIKDRIDPAGLIDRLTLWICRAITVSLRTQKENLLTLERQVLDVKKLLRTVEFIGRLTPYEWELDADAEEAVFELDEKLIEMEAGIDDADGVIKAMNAKAREKVYRGAAREAAKRMAYEMMDKNIELNDSVVVRKIIIKTDVLKAMAVAHASCYTFLQYKAAVDEKGDPSGAVKPVADKKAFVSDLNDWEKVITDFPKTFVNVKRVYDSERDEFETDKISFETLLKNDAYLRASSKKRFKSNEELLFFLRCMEFNGLGKVYFKNRPDQKKDITFKKKDYSTVKFRPAAEMEDLSDAAQRTMTLIMESVGDFVPFK